ncbi:KEOPS complex subunit Pcc1 [Halorarum halobium]|uniref:KEOPS complex subunit Pcc1 n=1 Tax=Halorarum halobium TaxID=3075121 RepID=UPI0028A86FA6|nr:KEOPS complex subunit Pcc1 [Halobaculum sp. XH14]
MTEESRTATFETRHADAVAAATVADALAPDNTPQMHTASDGDVVRTRIERETTGGLHASADDYLVNVTVADAVVADARTDDPATDATTATDARADDHDATDDENDTNANDTTTHDTTDTHE